MKGGEALDEMDELERRFLAAWSDPKRRRACRRADLRRNLSRRTRARLAVTQLHTSAGIWLVYHDHLKAAAWLWGINKRRHRRQRRNGDAP